MNKALSWQLGGAGSDAREAAREAARRQGKSLGEWLHGVIADEAAEQATHADYDDVEEARIRAVTARLERMGSRGRPPERRLVATDDRKVPSPAGSRRTGSDDPAERMSLPPLDSTRTQAADVRLENAIVAMERSALRSERQAEDVLASLNRLLKTSEQRREGERADVATLAGKLASIDARLEGAGQSPVKGELARLEARLEQIGRRSEAEADARRTVKTGAGRPAEAEPMQRLEAKLNALLEAVTAGRRPAGPDTSPIALAAAQRRPDIPQPELPLRRRRLGQAIADIADRQRALDPLRAENCVIDTQAVDSDTAGDALASHLGGLRRKVAGPHLAAAGDRLDFDALRSDIAAMAAQLRELAPRRTVTAIETQISQMESRLAATRSDDASTAIHDLKIDVQAIGGRIDSIASALTPIETTRRLETQIEAMREVVAQRLAQPAGADVGMLENLVGELGRRIEAVQAPGAGKPALDALQRQVGTLAARLDSAESGLASLATVERSIRDLFAHLEETRGLAESSMARAAQEAVRAAVAEKGFDRPAPRADVAVLKAMQEDADLRTRATLDVVHGTLDKVVERLAAMERGLAETRPDHPTQTWPPSAKDGMPSTRYATDDDLSLGAAEPSFGPRVGGRPGSKRPVALAAVGERVVTNAGAGKADFIAAARRAAAAAQSDPSFAALRMPAGDDSGVARAGLLAKSRDYVASHKRPVLLALAAVLVVAATMALVQRLPLGLSGAEVAGTAAPARLAEREAPASRAVPSADAQLGAMTPKALPRGTPALVAKIPGSDPIATASIPSLPAFAAHAAGPASTPAPPALPAGLVRMAEAGNGAAAYTLATAYAEGRFAPRDFSRAAKLYAKAAAQGIVPAQYRLGALYEKGLGVVQDKARAKSLYQQAADAGNPRAMHNLAVLLADGDGKPDYEGAATWFRKAAQYGVHDSQFNLAILLARGLGVDQSLVQSYQWFAVAAAQGDTDAAGKRDEVGSRLSASELSVAKALAAAFHPRTADPAATEVAPPPGGWDGETSPVRLNSTKTKIS